MGDVYKARDTRLDRIVAIKVSKEQFSERFEREARAVAALNHPHVCRLFVASLNSTGKTLVIPLPAGKSLPEFPVSGISLRAAPNPGTRLIEHDWISSVSDPSTYAFAVGGLQGNLFRIPLH